MLYLTVLFVVVLLLLAYALSGDKGKNTVYARRHPPAQVEVSNTPSEAGNSNIFQAN